MTRRRWTPDEDEVLRTKSARDARTLLPARSEAAIRARRAVLGIASRKPSYLERGRAAIENRKRINSIDYAGFATGRRRTKMLPKMSPQEERRLIEEAIASGKLRVCPTTYAHEAEPGAHVQTFRAAVQMSADAAGGYDTPGAARQKALRAIGK